MSKPLNIRKKLSELTQTKTSIKIIDNFDLFRSIMKFNSSDEFYFIQILIRGKDGHTKPGVNGNNKNRLIKIYTIKSVEHLTKVEQEIKAICKAVNGRAYIHPTKRSFREVANEMFKTFTETYISQNDIGLKGCYSTACGKSYISKDKKYIVDLDGDDVYKLNKIVEFIENECEPIGTLKLQYIVPTAHGKHLICKAFNTAKFGIQYPSIDVHKNNPTLLYFECSD